MGSFFNFIAIFMNEMLSIFILYLVYKVIRKFLAGNSKQNKNTTANPANTKKQNAALSSNTQKTTNTVSTKSIAESLEAGRIYYHDYLAAKKNGYTDTFDKYLKENDFFIQARYEDWYRDYDSYLGAKGWSQCGEGILYKVLGEDGKTANFETWMNIVYAETNEIASRPVMTYKIARSCGNIPQNMLFKTFLEENYSEYYVKYVNPYYYYLESLEINYDRSYTFVHFLNNYYGYNEDKIVEMAYDWWSFWFSNRWGPIFPSSTYYDFLCNAFGEALAEKIVSNTKDYNIEEEEQAFDIYKTRTTADDYSYIKDRTQTVTTEDYYEMMEYGPYKTVVTGRYVTDNYNNEYDVQSYSPWNGASRYYITDKNGYSVILYTSAKKAMPTGRIIPRR